MLSHVLYFLRCSARNQVRRQLRRLRKPRYAIAGLLGLAYFYFVFGGWAAGRGSDGPGTLMVEVGRSIGPLFLGLLAAWWWLWGGHRYGLVLSPAETHMLVPAPLTRRALIRFKILQAQLPIFMSAALGALLTRGGPLPWPFRLIALWIMLATLHQHQIAASLVHAAAEEQGRRGVRRHIVPLALFAAAFVALVWALTRAAVQIRAAASMDFALERIAALMTEPAPLIVLAPFRLLLAPVLAATPAAWATAVALAVPVLLLHYVWIQRTDAAFEEAAAREGENREIRVAAVRAGGMGRLRFSRLDRPRRLARPLLPLDLSARPAFAILWKNVLYSQRVFRPKTLLFVGAGLLVLLSPALLGGDAALERTLFRAAVLLLAVGGFMIAFGPVIIRNDLRMDLVNVQTLRTYPLHGREVVTAAIASAVVVVSLIELPLLLGGITLLAMAGRLTAAPAAAGLLLVLVATPIVTALSVTIQNGIALLYPGWTRIGPADTGGMEAVGQNMLIMIGTILLLGLALIPPLLVAAAVGAPLTLLSPVISIPAAAAAGLVAAAGEVVLFSIWLGRLYDRTDPVAAGLLR